MRRALLGAIVGAAMTLLAPASSAFAHPPAIVGGPAEKALAEEVADFRKRLAKAVADRDAKALRSFYADSYRHTHPNGRLDGKDARIALLLSGAAVIETAHAHDVVISVPNGWASAATGRSRIGAREVRWTVTYVRAGESWQVAAAHETAITAPR